MLYFKLVFLFCFVKILHCGSCKYCNLSIPEINDSKTINTNTKKTNENKYTKDELEAKYKFIDVINTRLDGDFVIIPEWINFCQNGSFIDIDTEKNNKDICEKIYKLIGIDYKDDLKLDNYLELISHNIVCVRHYKNKKLLNTYLIKKSLYKYLTYWFEMYENLTYFTKEYKNDTNDTLDNNECFKIYEYFIKPKLTYLEEEDSKLDILVEKLKKMEGFKDIVKKGRKDLSYVATFLKNIDILEKNGIDVEHDFQPIENYLNLIHKYLKTVINRGKNTEDSDFFLRFSGNLTIANYPLTFINNFNKYYNKELKKIMFEDAKKVNKEYICEYMKERYFKQFLNPTSFK